MTKEKAQRKIELQKMLRRIKNKGRLEIRREISNMFETKRNISRYLLSDNQLYKGIHLLKVTIILAINLGI